MIEAVAQILRRTDAHRGAGRRGGGITRPGALAILLRRPRLLFAVAATAVLLGCAWLWLRDSSLVAVNRVAVKGASGRDASQVRAALALAARNMTTLDVRMDQLRTAVAPYPAVKDLRVNTQFPHGMTIQVVEQIPVAVVIVEGHRTAVAGDGTLLHDMAPPPNLAVVPLRVPPGGSRLTDRDALGAVTVLAAAPYQLLARVSQVTSTAAHGLVAELRSGPSIYFGDSNRVAAKWMAAAAVLADASSAGAAYIDVSDPERPAAGGVGTVQGGAGGTGSGGAGTGGTTAGGGGASGGATSGAAATAPAGVSGG